MYDIDVNKTPRGITLCLSMEQRRIEPLESWQHCIIVRGKCNEDESARQSMAQDGNVLRSIISAVLCLINGLLD